MKLTYSKFQLAREYLMENGRELEQQRFKFHIGKAAKESVVYILKKHQNEDVGFQQMGEGEDFESSPIGTSIAIPVYM